MARSLTKLETILAAGREVILKHGLRGASMEAIAARAGVAKPTLYAYFPDKQALFAALLDRVIGTWRGEFLDALASEGDLVQRVAAAGLVRRRGDPDDARATRIELTKRAIAFAPVAAEVVAELEAELTARIAELGTVRAGLRTIAGLREGDDE